MTDKTIILESKIEQLESDKSEIISYCKLLISQYNKMPDGPLGKGLTNKPFFQIKDYLHKHGIEI